MKALAGSPADRQRGWGSGAKKCWRYQASGQGLSRSLAGGAPSGWAGLGLPLQPQADMPAATTSAGCSAAPQMPATHGSLCCPAGP